MKLKGLLTTKIHEKNNKIKTLHETLNKESIISLKFEKSTSYLNNLLGQQRDSSDKRGIGFGCYTDKGEESKSHGREYKNKIHNPRYNDVGI